MDALLDEKGTGLVEEGDCGSEDAAVRDALLYRFFSIVCQQPSKLQFGTLFNERERIFAALRTLLPQGEEGRCLSALEDAWSDDAHWEQLAAEYVRLFRGLVPRRWARPAYESVYRASDLEGCTAVVREVNRSYREFGLEPCKEDAPDFIATELDVMRFLLEESGEEGNDVRAAKWCDNHLREWIPAYCQEMGAAAESEYYRVIAEMLGALLGAPEDSHAPEGREKAESG